MAQTRKRKVICYDGIGSHKSGVHTAKNFLRRMRRFKQERNAPANTNVNGWMKWSGAEYMDAKVCRKIAKQTREDVKESRRRIRRQQIPGTEEYKALQAFIKERGVRS